MMYSSGMRATLCFGIFLALIAAGCVHRNVDQTQSGSVPDERAFAQITLGKTSAAWAASVMGEPAKKTKTDAGTEIWTWTSTESKTVDAQFFIVSDHSQTTNHRTATIEVKDGIVINKWLSTKSVNDQSHSGT